MWAAGVRVVRSSRVRRWRVKGGGDAVDEDAVFRLDDRDRFFCCNESHLFVISGRRTKGT